MEKIEVQNYNYKKCKVLFLINLIIGLPVLSLLILVITKWIISMSKYGPIYRTDHYTTLHPHPYYEFLILPILIIIPFLWWCLLYVFYKKSWGNKKNKIEKIVDEKSIKRKNIFAKTSLILGIVVVFGFIFGNFFIYTAFTRYLSSFPPESDFIPIPEYFIIFTIIILGLAYFGSILTVIFGLKGLGHQKKDYAIAGIILGVITPPIVNLFIYVALLYFT